MVLASYIRLALVGAALLFSQAQATFDFSSCAANCITSSGCDSDSARCMCREARELLLDSVISCLFFNCKDDLRDFENAFLDPIEEGCEDSDRDIPRSKLRAAESLASSYIGKIPSPATTKSTPLEVTPTPKPTKKPDPTTTEAPSPSTATEEDNTPSTTSTTDRQSARSSSTTAAVTPAVVSNPPAQSSAAPSESPAPDDSGSGGRAGGGDPFGTTGGSVGSAIQPFLALLGLPVVAALLALE